ncbi:transmembrane protein, putative [Medicago truncatula]|uniref:Transmembrane protein, putative n=1 Tax=Medicago truncatula TaxID=3880 RepID=G7KTQ2_MEDTR|nr:transmembrane protein, putative [Medicago truncatula]
MHVWISDEIVRIRTSDYDFVTYQIVDHVEITTVHLDHHQSHCIFKYAAKVVNSFIFIYLISMATIDIA